MRKRRGVCIIPLIRFLRRVLGEVVVGGLVGEISQQQREKLAEERKDKTKQGNNKGRTTLSRFKLLLQDELQHPSSDTLTGHIHLILYTDLQIFSFY